MSGYTIVEYKNTTLNRREGYQVKGNRLEIADFIRELNEDPFPFSFGDEVIVEGLDKALYDSGDDVNETANQIRHIFSSKASDVNNKQMTINIVIVGKLQYGAYLTVRYTQKDLPLNKIFHSVNQFDDANGNTFYTTNANLSG